MSSRSAGLTSIVLGHVDVAEVARDVHVAAHRAADDDDLAAGVDRDVDRLLHPVDVRREARDEHASLPRRDDLPERLADDALGAREAGRAPRSSSRRAAGRRRGCRARRAGRRRCFSPSTGVWSSFQSPVWKTRPADVSIAMPTASGIECAMRMNSMRNGPRSIGAAVRIGLAQLGRAQQAVLVELRLDEPERQARRPDLARPAPRASGTAARRRGPRARASARPPGPGGRAGSRSPGRIRSTPRCSSRGNAIPASTTIRSSPSSKTVMFLPDLAEPAERDHAKHVSHERAECSVGGRYA